MNIITKHKDTPTGKSVLLFSGGMDCLMASFLLKPDVLLYVRHGNSYERFEMECIGDLSRAGVIRPVQFVSFPWLGTKERDDGIIPLRNLFLLSIAALFGERIYIGAMLGDRTLDKSKVFLGKMQEMFDYLFQDQHWCEQRSFSVEAPFKDYTKTQLVAEFLKKGGDPKALLLSFSCYSPKNVGPGLFNRQACGQCKPCFRKWVALVNNGVEIPEGYFSSAPWEAPWLSEVLPSMRQGSYRGVLEDGETLRALATVGVR